MAVGCESSARVDELESLWLVLFEHIVELGPSSAPPLAPEESWRRARRIHLAILDHRDSFLLVAERDGAPVAYGLVAVDKRQSVAWDVVDRRAELADLSVLSAVRGRGVGTALIREAKAGVRAIGLSRLSVDVLATNEDAMALYRREGFAVDAHEMSVRLDAGGERRHANAQ